MGERAQDSGQQQAPAAQAWADLCILLDGVALGAMIEALEAKGCLAEMRHLESPGEPVHTLAQRWGARSGYLHLLCRALAHLGLLVVESGPSEETRVYPSQTGRVWLALSPAYRGFGARLQDAAAMPGWADGAGTPNPLPPMPALLQGDTRMQRWVAGHLHGPLLGAFLTLAYRRASRCDPDRQPAPEQIIQAAGAISAYGKTLLVRQGWGHWVNGEFVLAPVGHWGLRSAPQCFHTLSYLPTLIRSGRLLFGRDDSPPQPSPDGHERHLDRALDIAFSGLVFRRGCGEPFLRQLLPLFQAAPPTCVVDVGCGDGTLLLEVGKALRSAGFDLGGLTLVGVDPAPEARAETASRLTDAGLRHLVMTGDIGDPASIAARLQAHGLDLRDGLFVSKSVLHDRQFEPPAAATPMPSGPNSRTVFIGQDGALLVAAEVERHLIDVLVRWRPWVGRHGMLVIEAHTADPSDSARHAGRHILVPLEVTHGLSHQYLLEAQRFRALVRQAGYQPVAQHDLNTWLVGRPLMTIDHYVSSSVRNERITSPTPAVS